MRNTKIRLGFTDSARIASLIMGLGILFSATILTCPGETNITALTVTTLADLATVAAIDESKNVRVDIAGTVWWSSEVEGRIILYDGTEALQLEMQIPNPMPLQGERIRMSGTCALIRARDVVIVSSVPVIENNGLHSTEEKSATVYLGAGRHPIRLGWFNRTDRFGLQIEYDGPDVKRGQIPDSWLSHARRDAATGTTNFVNGLEYRYCEGQWWRQLPNFDHLPAVNEGVADNFDIGVRSRDSHVGVQFSGYLDVPEDGNYTFYLSSDDGSRLFIGPPSLRIQTVGRGTLPSAATVRYREPVQPESEFQWSEIEGDVVAVHRQKNTLELELMTEVGLVRIKVAEDSDGSYILQPHNRIRAIGVSRRILNLDGQWVRGDFFVQQWSDIDQRYISPSIWAEYPVLEIASLRGAHASPAGSVVHLRGKMLSADTPGAMVLSDGEGEIAVRDADASTFEGRVVDILGRIESDGTNLCVGSIFFRQVGSEGMDVGDLPVLTTIEQIYQLSLEESARRYPVKVRGVITSPMESDGAVLQDSSRGIYVVLGGPINLQIGDYCEVEGFTGPYTFSQFIEASRVEVLGAGNLPKPVKPTWDQLINGSLHCNYVELEGVVSSVSGDTVTLLTRDGRINVRLNPRGPDMPPDALGATVLLRGCLLADWDSSSRRVVVGSIYLDQHWVALIHPAPMDPFSIPLKRVDDLLQFDPQAGALQRVKVSGVLVHKDDELCCLMDGSNGLRFKPNDVADVDAQIGDAVDVVGFVELGGPVPVLQEARVRRTGRGNLPAPLMLHADNLLRDEYDSTRVRVKGVLLGMSEKPDRIVLELQNELRRFVAELQGTDMPESLTPGSRLELTGVYVGQGGNRILGRSVDSFRLLVGNRSDISVLSRPPWWTLRRMLSVLGVMAAILVAALVWIKLLRKTIEERTVELESQIRKRQRAERQREIEQERARLAHDLHDDLGARLTEVNMLASLVKSPATSPEEKKRYANELNDIALLMVTSLDEIVWAVNPRNDTVASLAGYFGAYAQRFLELASINCGLDVAENLPDISLDPRFRQEVFLAFKEALANIIHHASAKKVWLRIFVQNKDLVVIVSDDGCGILSGEQGAGADGLQNMKERLAMLKGRCSIHSDPQNGTIVRLQAPIRKATV